MRAPGLLRWSSGDIGLPQRLASRPRAEVDRARTWPPPRTIAPRSAPLFARRTLSRTSARRLTCAVAAPMLGARAAGFDEALLQRLTGPEHPHAGVARRQPVALGERLHRHAVHVDCMERLSVLGLERAGQASNAAADFRREFRLGRGVRLELARERLGGAAGGGAAPERIDRRVSERAIEPRRCISKYNMGCI